MSDFESEPTRPHRATASAALIHAMTEVEARCNDLARRIDLNDLARVVQIARGAANLWLTGRDAYRRLVERETATSATADAGRRRLHAARTLLLAAIARAGESGDLATRGELDGIRREFVTATRESLVGAPEEPEASRTDDTQEMALED